MKEEVVLKVGLSAKRIYKRVVNMLRIMRVSAQVDLDQDMLCILKIRIQDWDLAGTDDFFACMRSTEFEIRRPSEPIEPFESYEDVEYPDDDPPYNVFGFKTCGYAIARFFDTLQDRKISEDGHGISWPQNPPSWVPGTKYLFEDLHKGTPIPSPVMYRVESFFHYHSDEDKPHRVYYMWHADEGREGVIQRSELEVFLRCIMSTIVSPKLCMHNIPVLLLSIHGAKARIMIAHFNLSTDTFDIKCSKFEQFDGFEVKEKIGDKVGRVRPYNFEATRDLFFRWINPACQGDTYLKDTKDGEELIERKRKGRKRLVPRKLQPKPSNSESSEAIN